MSPDDHHRDDAPPPDADVPELPAPPVTASAAPAPPAADAERAPEPPAKEPEQDKASSRAAAERYLHRFVQALFRLMKIARLHDVENQALVQLLDELQDAVSEGLRMLGVVVFQFEGDNFRINDIQVRLEEDTFALAQFLSGEFSERGVGTFQVTAPVNPRLLKQYLLDFYRSPRGKRSCGLINRELRNHAIPIQLHEEIGTGLGKGHEAVEVDRRIQALLLYARMVALLKRVVVNLDDRRMVARLARSLQRCVQSVVNICLEDAHSVIGLAQIKDYDEYEYHHAVNVAILSVILGLALGLERTALNDLGVCALFYDLGNYKIPREILDKQGKLTEEEWRVIRRHPMLSVSTIMKLQRFSPALLRRMVVAFEHHIAYDGSGYPEALRGWGTDLYTRIIAVSDVFDAMTTRRPARTALTADEALRLLMRDAGSRFDPLVVKVFVNTVGIYPVGTVMQLSDGTYGVVLIGGREPHLDRPKVKIVADGSRRQVDGRLVDLAAQREDGSFLLDVERVADADLEGIPVPRYITEL